MENIRNFAIIAHVDHGKSTLADRLLEITGTVSSRQMKNQILDSNPIERERGITIKLAPVRMAYTLDDIRYTLNLIDTPGHVDFSYEVNRSLAACEGAILLIDATQGVQAQTLAHFRQAKNLGLTIIPVINKIDIDTADIAQITDQMIKIFGFNREEILHVSGKTGQGVPQLLETIIHKIPAPKGAPDGTPRALIFNSNFDQHLGILAWIRVVDGTINTGDIIYFIHTQATATALEIGIFSPHRYPIPSLSAGEVGYIVTNLKDLSTLQVGDTVFVKSQISNLKSQILPLPGYQPIKPVVFISFYPTDGAEINFLRTALQKLQLEDSALNYSPEFSPALGNGFRVGLLGLLHADIVQERIEREYGISLIAAAPSVEYQILTKSGNLLLISKAETLPDPSQIAEIREPVINLSVFVPREFVGPVIQLCQDHRGSMSDMEYLDNMVNLHYSFPLVELIHHFYDQLKSISQGYATLDYDLAGYQVSDLVKLDILIGGDKVDALSQIVPQSKSRSVAIDLVNRLQGIIPRQQFEISIQATIGSHVLARSDIKAYRKDVTAKLYGGDRTRRDKLLKKQKRGKSRMKRIGQIDLPQAAFMAVLGTTPV